MKRLLWIIFRRLIRWTLQATGLLAILWVLSAMTPLPWRVVGWLASDLDGSPSQPPDHIVVLGGGGIPSESGLMRTYHAAALAAQYPEASVIVAMPQDGKDRAAERMADELNLRGVSRHRIQFEPEGRNTWEQARNTALLLGLPDRQPVVLVVTSPEHMRRSLLSFRKAGFQNLRASPGWSVAIEADLNYHVPPSKPRPLRNLGANLLARYRIWDNLVLQAKILREIVGLAYYRHMDWN
ncbi:MAG TPA: YdcF family protein [Kiritimatiellia bacterium]|nr:YdcF family protein [Kiritimatiellia bacterium]